MNKTKTKEITFTEALGIIMVFILFITSPIWLIGTWVILVSIALNKEVFYPAKLILSIDFLIVIMLSLYVILYYIEKKENKMNNFVSMDIKKLGETIMDLIKKIKLIKMKTLLIVLLSLITFGNIIIKLLLSSDQINNILGLLMIIILISLIINLLFIDSKLR